MTVSKISLEERLERKRNAARLRQQRCRSRKRDEALLAKKQQQQTREPISFVSIVTPSIEKRNANERYRESQHPVRLKVPFRSHWQQYWRESAYYHEDAQSLPNDHTHDYPSYEQSPHVMIYDFEALGPQNQMYMYKQRCPSYDQISQLYARDEYSDRRMQTSVRQMPPKLPLLLPEMECRTFHDHHERGGDQEYRATPEHQSFGEEPSKDEEAAAIDAILSLKNSGIKPVPTRRPPERPKPSYGQYSEGAFLHYHRPAPLRYHQNTRNYDRRTKELKPGLYLTMRFK